MGEVQEIENSERSARFADHLAIRLADLDLTRATDQAAIMMSLFASIGGNHSAGPELAEDGRRGRRNSPQGDRLSLTLMLGYLAHAYCRGTIIHLDSRFTEKKTTRDGELWNSVDRSRARFLDATLGEGAGGTEPQAAFGIAPPHSGPGPSPWDLEFVISPLDGTRALLGGMRTGTVSAIAGGPPGSFIAESDETLASAYLLVALAPYLSELGLRLSRLAQEELEAGHHKGDLTRPPALEERLSGLIDVILQEIKTTSLGLKKRPTVATSTNKPDFADSVIRQRLVRMGRTSTSIGSALIAGLGPYFPLSGVDAYVGVVRKTQALQIAAGAQASGGSVVAIPVEDVVPSGLRRGKSSIAAHDALSPTVKGSGSRMRLAANAQLRVQTQDTLVPNRGHDVFLVATGVTDTGLLRKVQVSEDGIARTHTLCMRSKAKSCRLIETSHDLQNRVFRVCASKDRVIAGFLADLEQMGIKLRVIELPGATAARPKSSRRQPGARNGHDGSRAS